MLLLSIACLISMFASTFYK